MLKRIIDPEARNVSPANDPWLHIDASAQVEVTSEDEAHPIESALIPGAESGWRAGEPGQQTIRLLFDEPQKIKRVHLEFYEDEWERTQQFIVRWSSDRGQSYCEIVRQQYNFSPAGTTSEREDYKVDLDRVTTLEISIVPDISGGLHHASLVQLRLG